MLKVLFRLYALSIIRNLTKSRIFARIYLLALIVFLVFLVNALLTEEWVHLFGQPNIAEVMTFVAVSSIIPDFLAKLIMKPNACIMDDSLRTRPISKKSWAGFVVFTNIFDFWNWLLPMAFSGLILLNMHWCQMILCFLLFFSLSLVNGVAVSVMKLGQGWEYKTVIVFIGIFWIPLLLLYCLNLFHLQWAIHTLGIIALCMVMLCGLYRYCAKLHSYDDYSAKVGSTFSVVSSVRLLEPLGYLRSKRLLMLMLMPFFFVIQLFLADKPFNSEFMTNSIILIFLAFSSLSMGGCMLSIEANFMDGLWSRPLKFRRLFCNIYYFYCTVTLFYSVLALIILHESERLSMCYFVSATLYVLGVQNLIVFFYVFATERIDLFSSVFFNHQGSQGAWSAGMVMILPFFLILIAMYFIPLKIMSIIFASLGILGLTLHRFVLNWFAKKYSSHRYVHFERYRD